MLTISPIKIRGFLRRLGQTLADVLPVEVTELLKQAAGKSRQ